MGCNLVFKGKGFGSFLLGIVRSRIVFFISSATRTDVVFSSFYKFKILFLSICSHAGLQGTEDSGDEKKFIIDTMPTVQDLNQMKAILLIRLDSVQ